MSETASERRRDYTVSRPVQLIYMATWIGSIALLAGFAGLAWSARELSESALAEVTLLGMSGLLVLGILAFLLVVIALALGVYAIVHTHRMVGSSYRIRTVLTAIREGKLETRATLRDGDYFQDVADELNAMLDGLGVGKGGASDSAGADKAKADDKPEETDKADEAKAEDAKAEDA